MAERLKIGRGHTTRMNWDEFREFMRDKLLYHFQQYTSYGKRVRLELDASSPRADGWSPGYVPDGVIVTTEDALGPYPYAGYSGYHGYSVERTGQGLYSGHHRFWHLSVNKSRFYVTEHPASLLVTQSELRTEA